MSMGSHCGAEYYFVDLGGLHLVYTFFLFPVSTSQFIGEFRKNRQSRTSDVVPIVQALYSSHSLYYWCCVASGAYKRSGESSPPLQAKRGEFAAPIRTFCGFFFCCASPISIVQIAGPILLAQHQGNKRIGKARTSIRPLHLLLQKSFINFAVLTGDGNMFNTR